MYFFYLKAVTDILAHIQEHLLEEKYRYAMKSVYTYV